MTSTAAVPTSKPVAYLRQLCTQFRREADESVDDDRVGRIAFPFGRCELIACVDRLDVRVSARAREDLARLEELVATQLERLGLRDGLAVAWTRVA